MNHDYYYHTCCVHSTARAINNMVDDAQDITWETFRKHVHWSEVKRIFRDYSYRREILWTTASGILVFTSKMIGRSHFVKASIKESLVIILFIVVLNIFS